MSSDRKPCKLLSLICLCICLRHENPSAICVSQSFFEFNSRKVCFSLNGQHRLAWAQFNVTVCESVRNREPKTTKDLEFLEKLPATARQFRTAPTAAGSHNLTTTTLHCRRFAVWPQCLEAGAEGLWTRKYRPETRGLRSQGPAAERCERPDGRGSTHSFFTAETNISCAFVAPSRTSTEKNLDEFGKWGNLVC